MKSLRQYNLKPDYAYVYINCGNTKSNLGDKQGAIADYNEAIRLKPNFADPFRLNPNFADPYYNRGLIKKERGEKQEALADFRKASELYQGNPLWYNNSLDMTRELEG